MGSTDKALAATRQLLFQAMHYAQAGHDPQHIVRDAAANDFPDMIVASIALPSSENWRSEWVFHAPKPATRELAV